MEHDVNEGMEGGMNRPDMEADDEEDLPAPMLRQRRRRKKKKISLKKKSKDPDSHKPTIVNFDQSLPSSHSVRPGKIKSCLQRYFDCNYAIQDMPHAT